MNPADKLTPAFAKEVINFCYHNSANRNLLDGKKIDQIEQYSVGEFDLKPFMRMFKSMKKVMELHKNQDGSINEDLLAKNDTTGLDWTCLPLIPTKLNAAVNLVQKIPIEVTCKALDALAMKKRNEDLNFLKNKSLVEPDIQDFADQMGVGKVDLGTTIHSATKFSESPMGLDLNKPDEEDVFIKLMYSLQVESAFEKCLQQFYNIKKASQVKLLEIRDQYKWGVSCNWPYTSSMTQLPDFDYIYPGDMSVPASDLPDYSDNTHRFLNKRLTVLEMFNYFSDEICDEETLGKIINGEKGYCKCNNTSTVDAKQWSSYKINMKYVEVKSVDWVGVVDKEKSKRGVTYFTQDEKECTRKIWGQNTYGFWWLVGTDYFFGIHRLDYSYRTKGRESYQNFSTNIYKSQTKSAVELSIGENKKAQIAEIKLQHLILKSLPPGKYIDLRYVRGALSGLKEEGNVYTMQQLINMAFEQNVIIGDTEGFEGKNDGQLKPFMDIIGGLKVAEAQGYLLIIATANRNIGAYTGINEELSGESVNPEGLVGLQKLLINQSINALYHINEAIQEQYKCVFNNWANLIQKAIEAGGATKEAIINMIGVDDANVLDGLNDTPLHNLTIVVEVGQREEERDAYMKQLNFLKSQGVLSSFDEYILSGITSPRERFAFLAVREKKFKDEQNKIRQEDFANAQTVIKQQGENIVQGEAAKSEGAIKKEYAKGDVQANIERIKNQLGLSSQQMDAIIKRTLQKERNDDQTQKAIKTIEAKQNVKQQEPITA